MAEQIPKVELDTTIGPDVDLERTVVRDKSGRRITKGTSDRLVSAAELSAAKRKPGRPSLAGHGTSPSIAFRVQPELRAQAEAVAKREGKTVSALAREALESRVASG